MNRKDSLLREASHWQQVAADFDLILRERESRGTFEWVHFLIENRQRALDVARQLAAEAERGGK